MTDFIPFMIGLMILAAILRQDTVLKVFYLLFGVIIVGRWWSRRSLNNVSFERTFTDRAFLGQTTPVDVKITNKGWLPLIWLQIHESLPVALISPSFFRQVVTLKPHSSINLQYSLQANKRGFHSLGPIFFSTGDLWGVTKNDEKSGGVDRLVVYPKIIPLTKLAFPSNSPFGSLHHKNPIFEDPTRVRGKRDYQVGDSLRRVDWKATAVTHRLQVKLFEASISIDTYIFLDLFSGDYEIKQRFLTSELAIVVAASIANWMVHHKQSVGLSTNGIDPLTDDQNPAPLSPRKGVSHLMSLLEILARIQVGESESLAELLDQSIGRLTWGTTMVLITGNHDQSLLDKLFSARRAGMSVVLIYLGDSLELKQAQLIASRFGFPVYRFQTEADLDIWR